MLCVCCSCSIICDLQNKTPTFQKGTHTHTSNNLVQITLMHVLKNFFNSRDTALPSDVHKYLPFDLLHTHTTCTHTHHTCTHTTHTPHAHTHTTCTHTHHMHTTHHMHIPHTHISQIPTDPLPLPPLPSYTPVLDRMSCSPCPFGPTMYLCCDFFTSTATVAHKRTWGGEKSMCPTMKHN